MKRGEIYYLRFDYSYGHEMTSGRPAVVVSSEKELGSSPLVQVVYGTTSRRDYENCYKIDALDEETWVICNHINTVDKRRFARYMGSVTDEEMEEIDKRIKRVLGYDDDEIEMYEPLVPVVEPVDIRVAESNDDKIAELKVELALYKKLYEKTLDKLVDLKLEKDTRLEPTMQFVEKPRVEKEPEKIVKKCEVEKPQKNEVTKGRPTGSKNKGSTGIPMRVKDSNGKYRYPTWDEIEVYAKPTGKANINTDEWYVISATTRLSMSLTQSLVAYRNKHGEFDRVEDLINVSKFSWGVIERYRSKLEV